MDETQTETPVLESPRPRARSGLTPAQLKAAAKVVRAHLAQVDQRLRRVEPPPDRERPERSDS